jgi:hypothetical protein
MAAVFYLKPLPGSLAAAFVYAGIAGIPLECRLPVIPDSLAAHDFFQPQP